MARLFCFVMEKRQDFKLGADFYASVALRAANDLRKTLAIDEGSFRHVGPALWQDPRPAFIYRVLDEVQKAGIAIREWLVKLGGDEHRTDKSEGAAEVTDHLIRLVTQWQRDDQSFRARKLCEVLVELICFSETNDPEYYRDYLRLKDLDRAVTSLRDQNEFFGFKRRNTQYGVDWSEKDIKEAERNGLDVSKRWYLGRPSAFQGEWKTHGVRFSSFRQRYIRILDTAMPNELAIIGKSYVHAYGMSSDVHFSAHDISSDFDPDDVYSGIDRVGLLCYAIVIRCQQLLGTVPEGLNATIRKMHDENEVPAKLVAGLKEQKADVGDYVWAHGDICEVIEVRKSRHGYVSYLARFIEKPPIPDIKEDWFAAFEVRLVAKKALAQSTLHELERGKDTAEQFAKMTPEHRRDLVGKAVAKCFHLQRKILRETKLRQSTTEKPKV
jgi:hypothetical protein